MLALVVLVAAPALPPASPPGELPPSDVYVAAESVAVEGDLLAVAYLMREDGRYSGAVEVRAGDAEPVRLPLGDSLVWPGTFLRVATDGRVVVVGVPSHGMQSGEGTVHVFARVDDEWQQVQVLRPERERTTGFGRSLALAGELLVVGDPYDREPPKGSGSAWTYRRVGERFELEARLERPAATSRFGDTVATDGRTILAASCGEVSAPVHVYERGPTGAWDFAGSLRLGSRSRSFVRTALAVRGNELVVGTKYDRGDRPDAVDVGSAHVFQRDAEGWHLTARLVPEEPEERGYFGRAVSLGAGWIAVGHPGLDDGGRVVRYELYGDEWLPVETLFAPGRVTWHGKTLATDGALLAIGATADWRPVPNLVRVHRVPR